MSVIKEFKKMNDKAVGSSVGIPIKRSAFFGFGMLG
jgi:hypothetical protein